MSIPLTVFSFVMVAVLAIQGCSDNTRDNMKDVGKSLKSDINEGANDLNRKVEDAMD